MEGISVIIPCLNEEHYIGKLLNSLLKQTYNNFEVNVVDGKSTDKTIEVIRDFIPKFKDFKVELRLWQPDKRGVSYQRNFGASQSKYERLLFLDADVQVKAHFLESSINELNNRHLDLATCDFEPMSSRVDDKLLYSIACVYFKVLQYSNPITMGWCIFSNKNVHSLINGFDENMKFGEDSDYAQRAAVKGFKLRVLKRAKVFVSVRRLNDEGRLNYYKKVVTAEMYRFLNGKIDKELFDYEFGKFKEDLDTKNFDTEKTNRWNRILEALQVNGKNKK